MATASHPSGSLIFWKENNPNMNLISKIKGLAKHSAVQNGMWMYALQIFNTVLPLLTLPYITRILGEAKYGVFSFALNLVSYLQVFIEYGFPLSATRDVVAANGDKEKINRIFSGVLFARLWLLAASAVILGGTLLLFMDDLSQLQCMAVLAICLVGSCLQQDWLFQGLQKMKYISLVNIIGRVVSVALVFCLVKKPEHLLLYCLLYSISPLLSGLIGTVLAKRTFALSVIRMKAKEIFQALKKGFFVFTTSLSAKIFGAIGITFLGFFSSDETVGIYSAIQKIPQMFMLAWTPVSQVLYPISSQKMQGSYKDGRKFVKKMHFLFMIPFALLSVVIALFSKPVIGLMFGAEYAAKAFWVVPLLVWMLLGISNNFLGVQTLLASGRDKEYSGCFQFGVICTVVLNFLFIYFGDGLGAAIAPAISEVLLCGALLLQIRKIKE